MRTQYHKITLYKNIFCIFISLYNSPHPSTFLKSSSKFTQGRILVRFTAFVTCWPKVTEGISVCCSYCGDTAFRVSDYACLTVKSLHAAFVVGGLFYQRILLSLFQTRTPMYIIILYFHYINFIFKTENI